MHVRCTWRSRVQGASISNYRERPLITQCHYMVLGREEPYKTRKRTWVGYNKKIHQTLFHAHFSDYSSKSLVKNMFILSFTNSLGSRNWIYATRNCIWFYNFNFIFNITLDTICSQTLIFSTNLCTKIFILGLFLSNYNEYRIEWAAMNSGALKTWSSIIY